MRYTYPFLFVLVFLSVSDQAGATPAPSVGATQSVQESTKAAPATGVPGASADVGRNVRLGYQAFVAKRYVDALGYLDEAIKASPTALALTVRGAVHLALGQNDAAASDFTQALSRDSRFPMALLGQAALYYQLHKLEPALEDYSAALAINPRMPEAYVGRGLILHEMHEPEKAASDFAEAGKLMSATDRVSAATHYETAGLLYKEAGRTSDALRYINAAIELTPAAGELYTSRGNMEKNQIGMGKALLDYETAIRLNPDDIEARDRLARLLEDMGQYQESLNEFNVIFRTPRDDAYLYLDHANLMMDMGRYDDAQRDYEIAAKLDPTSARVVHQRMQLRFYQGDYAAAVEDADLWLSDKGKIDTETNVEYTLLWRHISMQRHGIDDRAYMVKAAANLKNRAEWPYPLMQYSIARLGEKQLREAALRGDTEQIQQRQCETAGYIGERYLSQNQPDLAKGEFQRALAICPFSYIERSLASHELRSLAAEASLQGTRGGISSGENTPATPAR